MIVATRGDGYVVEFRGTSYSHWEEGEDSPFFRIHSALLRINISDLHCNRPQTLTSQPEVFPEWEFINQMFEQALLGEGSDADSSSQRGR